ncbi:MAG: flagellar basal body-associated FliL family protein [bacterium]
MAEEEKKEEEEEKKPKKGLPKGPIVIVLAIIIGLVLSSVVAIIVAKKVAKEDKIPEPLIKPEGIEEEEEEVYYFELGEFLAKIINPEEPTYVKLEKLTFSYDAKKYEFLIKELEERKPEMRDIINTILISSTPEIATKEGKEAFKEKVLEEINSILRDGQIENVFCEIIPQ